MTNSEISTTIPGSFRFKPQIDLVIEEFEDLGVRILAPPKGLPFSTPVQRFIRKTTSFRPLSCERGLPVKQVEDSFLYAIDKSSFVYVVNPEGYFGDVVSLEIGYSLARDKRIYFQFAPSQFLDIDPSNQDVIARIPVLSPSEALLDFTTPHP